MSETGALNQATPVKERKRANPLYIPPGCAYTERAVTSKRIADALFRHLVKVHARDLAASVVSSQLHVRLMTSGPPAFKERWVPPDA